MPSKNRFLVNLRGTPEFERFLRRLVRAAIKTGMPVEPGEFNKLTELAIYELAARLKVKTAERMPTPGKKKPDPKPKDEEES